MEQAIAAGPIVDQLIRQDFQGDLASEVGIDGAVHDAHAAAPQLSDDVVVGEAAADEGLGHRYRASFFCASATQPRSVSPSRQRSRKREYCARAFASSFRRS